MKCVICNSEIKSGLLDKPKQCADGSVCNDCYKHFPSLLRIKEMPYFRCKDWISYEKENKEQFTETSSFGLLHLDELHGLFQIESKQTDIYKITDLKSVALTLKKPIQEGNQMYADILFSFELKNHPFSIVIKKKDKLQAKPEGKVIHFSESYSLSVFRNVFQQAVENQYSSIRKMLNEFSRKDLGELEKAKALFMVDDEIDTEEIKKVRNVLIKAFHPDNSSLDSRYSEKINHAYSILIK